MEQRWYREGNGARFVPGLTRDYTLTLPNGLRLLVLSADLDGRCREAVFCNALWRYWFAVYGHAEARSRMVAYVRGEEVA